MNTISILIKENTYLKDKVHTFEIRTYGRKKNLLN